MAFPLARIASMVLEHITYLHWTDMNMKLAVISALVYALTDTGKTVDVYLSKEG